MEKSADGHKKTISEWRNVPGYDDIYEVSTTGQVRSLRSGIVLSTPVNSRGYRVAGLCRNGAQKKVTVHRLVATAFIPNPQNLPQINHIDFNKLNNEAGNLEWCTPLQNVKWSDAHSRRYRMDRSVFDGILSQYIGGISIASILKENAISPGTLYRVLKQGGVSERRNKPITEDVVRAKMGGKIMLNDEGEIHR